MIPAVIDLGCGTAATLRSTRLLSVFRYDHDSLCAPIGAHDKEFFFDVVVVTTRGRWQLHGQRGKTSIDASSLVVGVAGDEYGCMHDRHLGDSNLLVALDSKAVDPDCHPLFRKQIIPSQRSNALVLRALEADNDDSFDTLLFTLFDHASRAASPNVRHPYSKLRMQRAKRFIEFHATERINLQDIASELGLSPFTLLRQFREAIGKTPHVYLNELRLERARNLLARTNLQIDAIASAVGIDDQAYFSRFFKKATGHSPSTYRRVSGR